MKDKFNNEDVNLLNNFKSNYKKLIEYSNYQNVNAYIDFIVNQLFKSNKYFNDQEPWKKKNDTKRLNTIVYVSLELIRKTSILLYPIIPETSLKVLSIFGISEDEISFESILDNDFLTPNIEINTLDILFKKIEIKD